MATDESTKQALVGRGARGHSLAANLALACSLLVLVFDPPSRMQRCGIFIYDKYSIIVHGPARCELAKKKEKKAVEKIKKKGKKEGRKLAVVAVLLGSTISGSSQSLSTNSILNCF